MRDVCRVEALTWIRQYTIVPVRLIHHGMSEKVEGLKKPVESSTINDNVDVLLHELGTKLTSQKFLASLSIHTYASTFQRVFQAFRITFLDRKRSIVFLNVGIYIQRVLGGTRKAIPLVYTAYGLSSRNLSGHNLCDAAATKHRVLSFSLKCGTTTQWVAMNILDVKMGSLHSVSASL